MQRKRSVRAWSVLKIGIGILLAAAALDGSGRLASADPDEPSSTESSATVLPPEEEVARDAPVHEPFTLYSDDPGARLLEDLPPDVQEKMLDEEEAAAATEAEAAQVWSKYTHLKAAEAKTQKAAYQSGTQGLDELGVTP